MRLASRWVSRARSKLAERMELMHRAFAGCHEQAVPLGHWHALYRASSLAVTLAASYAGLIFTNCCWYEQLSVHAKLGANDHRARTLWWRSSFS